MLVAATIFIRTVATQLLHVHIRVRSFFSAQSHHLLFDLRSGLMGKSLARGVHRADAEFSTKGDTHSPTPIQQLYSTHKPNMAACYNTE